MWRINSKRHQKSKLNKKGGYCVYAHLSVHRFTEADLKAEEAERKITKLERELQEKEEKYEELLEKYNASKAELDELARQFEDL